MKCLTFGPILFKWGLYLTDQKSSKIEATQLDLADIQKSSALSRCCEERFGQVADNITLWIF